MTERLTLREELEREPIAMAFKEGMALTAQVIDELKERAVRYKTERDEAVRALEAIQEWLLDTAPVRDDGIMHPLFLKANNLTAAVLAKAEGR